MRLGLGLQGGAAHPKLRRQDFLKHPQQLLRCRLHHIADHMRSQASLAAGDGPQVKSRVRSARLERYPNEDIPLVGIKLIERLIENISNDLLFSFWNR